VHQEARFLASHDQNASRCRAKATLRSQKSGETCLGARHPSSPEHAFPAGEFAAAMGSATHAASLRERGIPVRAMIALEMIGFFTDAPGSQEYPLQILKLFYPSQGNFIGVVGKLGQGALVRRIRNSMRRASSLPVHSISAPIWPPGVDFSDHRSYWEAGYEAVMITDTAFYRNPNYHTTDDTPETLDYERMAMVVKGVYAAVTAEGERSRPV
jgi:Peptidase family M28